MAKMVANNYIEEENNVYLEVINTKGEKIYFLIDREELNFAKSKFWYACYCPKRHSHYLESKDRIKYHRAVMRCPDGMVVDHINRCTYDNRKVNMRVCTVAENNRNRYYPEIQRNPRKSKLGIPYLSFNNGYYDVRYPGCKRLRTKDFNEALEYLNKLRSNN